MSDETKDIIAELMSLYSNTHEMSVSADLNHEAKLWWSGSNSGICLAMSVVKKHLQTKR
jgi:hypothetical protein